MLSQRTILAFVLYSVPWFCASAQSVISAHSGVIHYSEGAVFVDGQRVEQKFGRFPEIKQGSELRTEDGRAEVLLTPGMFLRVGENSAIRMVSNRLTDTRVEFESGSAVFESVKANPGSAVVVVYKGSEVRFHTPGVYHFNAQPPELRVDEGEAQVLTSGREVAVKEGYVLPFSGSSATPQSTTDVGDALDSWSRRRSVSVAASDATAAQADDMAVLLNAPPVDVFGGVPSYGVFPYIPMIGGYPGYYGGYMGLGPWGSPFYTPGLRYYPLPAYSGYSGYRSGFSGYRPLSPIRTGSPTVFRPPTRVYTPSRPITTMPGIGHGGVHAGGHR